jgi:hypothetical protein
MGVSCLDMAPSLCCIPRYAIRLGVWRKGDSRSESSLLSSLPRSSCLPLSVAVVFIAVGKVFEEVGILKVLKVFLATNTFTHPSHGSQRPHFYQPTALKAWLAAQPRPSTPITSKLPTKTMTLPLISNASLTSNRVTFRCFFCMNHFARLG